MELARPLLTGKPEAFDGFVEHFRAKIFPHSWLMCGHREDAEEVAQELSLEQFLPARKAADGDVKIEIADWSQLPDDQLLQSELDVTEDTVKQHLHRARLALRKTLDEHLGARPPSCDART